MSLDSAVIGDIATLGAPILCVDTCTILDVIRDITRESIRSSDLHAGLTLVTAAESNTDLVVLMAEQVSIELNANLQAVQDEANEKLEKFVKHAQRIHEIATVFGASGAFITSHFDGHVSRARLLLDRWAAVARNVPSNPQIVGRALTRVNAPRTPARKGKESMKDCTVVETYLEVAQQLRSQGLKAPIVFASSNTKEYYAPNTFHLQSDIAIDLAAVKIDFAPTFGAAKHSLGL
jgi:hypothetical protein